MAGPLNWLSNTGMPQATLPTGGSLSGAFANFGKSGSPSGDQNWFGYMPENLQGFDKILADIMSGKGPTNPFITNLQSQATQGVRNAAAAQGTAYSGGEQVQEGRAFADIFNQGQQGQIADLLQYLGLARPQALAPQTPAPSGADRAFQLLGALGPAAIAAFA